MTEQQTLSAGHHIVKTLENFGVNRVYAVPGESYLDVLDGLHDSTIETVVCRQEGGAGFMALAEGRLSGVPGIAMVTRGPGAANAMIAIHTAWQDATPLVLFVGLIPVADREREAFQEFSLRGWFGTTAKRVITIDDPERAGELTAEALRIAAAGRPGPVVVGLPEDVLVKPVTNPRALTPEVFGGADPAAEAVSDQAVERLGQLLGKAKRPAFIVGGDGWHTGCGEQLAAFAELAGIPIFQDWRAYDAVPHQSPAYAGWLGYGRADAVANNYAASDLHIFVGCGRTDVLSDGYTLGLDTKTVTVTGDSAALGHSGRADLQLRAKPAAFVAALAKLDAAELTGNRDCEWLKACRADQERFAAYRSDASVNAAAPAIPSSNEASGVDLGDVFAELDRQLACEATLTFGAGNATIWAHRFIKHNRAASLVGARNGAMGLAVPAAVAASLITPNRHCVAVCGDGDYLMNGQEIATAFAHGAKPVIIVIDNGIYGTIVQHQEKHYPGRPSGTRMTNPDFAEIMRAHGGHGESVNQTAEFAGALERCLAAAVPALIHIKISPEVMPPASGEIA